MSLEIIALGSGTSQGVPLIGCKCHACTSPDPRDKRLRSSVYLTDTESKILIDIGPDFRTQFLENDLKDVDAILVTHEHNDHIIGLDDIRAINFTQQKSIPIYAMPRVCIEIRNRFPYIFSAKKYPGAPSVELIELDGNSFFIGNVKVTPIPVMHGKLEVMGYKLNETAYITDANAIPSDSMNNLKELDVLIINALRQDSHYSHFSLSEALDVISSVNPKRAFLTHISHNMGRVSEWSSSLPENVSPLSDGLKILSN